KAYVVWDYQAIHIAQLTDDLTDIVPGTEHVLFDKAAGMGEGSHFYKFDDKYYILSANYAGGMRMSAARADNVFGPYEVNRAISTNEDFGLMRGKRLAGKGPPFSITPPDPASRNGLSMHQGAIVKAPDGQWWGLSMMDANSIGRLTALSPVTWQDGWPWFGLPGNLTRTPRTWVKPMASAPQPVSVPYRRSDTFSEKTLQPVWQWNHVPVDGKWSLSEHPGYLRLHALPATSLWDARNSLTQRAIGPASSPTVALDASNLKPGDVAGLALLNQPYAWIGAEQTETGLNIALYDQSTDKTVRVATQAKKLYLRADCDFMAETARFSYSTDGHRFTPIGDVFPMVFQLTTFQGVRYTLFSFNTKGAEGGYADFDSIDIRQPWPHGIRRPIPYSRSIRLSAYGAADGLSVIAVHPGLGAPATFRVIDRGLGRVALSQGGKFLSVDKDGHVDLTSGQPADGQTFQWSETPTGELVLMSLATNRYLRIDPTTHVVSADSPGPLPDGSDGDRFVWRTAKGR
ncbi:MAG: beta-xylosidase family glycoside hydrolase, partial [Asticcacaulis sp.]